MLTISLFELINVLMTAPMHLNGRRAGRGRMTLRI